MLLALFTVITHEHAVAFSRGSMNRQCCNACLCNFVFTTFPVSISNTVNTDRYNPLTQTLFGVYNYVKECKAFLNYKV